VIGKDLAMLKQKAMTVEEFIVFAHLPENMDKHLCC